MLKPFKIHKQKQPLRHVSDPVCFIHIPKTAGTSFRKAAEQYWGNDRILKNYGRHSSETSIPIRNISDDPYDLKMLSDRVLPAMYTGHIHAKSCYHLFPAQQFVSFLRNPESQVLSHFCHAKRWNSFAGDLNDFILNSGTQNVQSKYLSGMIPELMGLLGITERYEQSLQLFNHRYNTQLKGLEENKNKSEYYLDDVSDETLGLIRQHNQQDLALYEDCLSRHQQRWYLYQDGMPWVHGIIGHMTDEFVGGWAFFEMQDQPVMLKVYVNDHLVGRVTAKEFRPHLRPFNPPRAGYIGYGYRLPTQLEFGDTVKVVVVETGQELSSRVFKPI